MFTYILVGFSGGSMYTVTTTYSLWRGKFDWIKKAIKFINLIKPAIKEAVENFNLIAKFFAQVVLAVVIYLILKYTHHFIFLIHI